MVDGCMPGCIMRGMKSKISRTTGNSYFVRNIVASWIGVEKRNQRWHGGLLLPDDPRAAEHYLINRFATMVIMVIEHSDDVEHLPEHDALNQLVIKQSRGEVRYWSSIGFKFTHIVYFFESKRDALFIKMSVGGSSHETREYASW